MAARAHEVINSPSGSNPRLVAGLVGALIENLIASMEISSVTEEVDPPPFPTAPKPRAHCMLCTNPIQHPKTNPATITSYLEASMR